MSTNPVNPSSSAAAAHVLVAATSPSALSSGVTAPGGTGPNDTCSGAATATAGATAGAVTGDGAGKASAAVAAAAAASEDPSHVLDAATAASLEKAVDICIAMDCTGSMASWIDACRDSLISTLNGLRAKFPRSRFRAAFVGYRDLCDAERFVLHPFNENVDALIASIRSVRAEGGGDTPEDVAGGLHHVLSLGWTGDVRLVLFCCDAPAHGDKYHDPNMSDHHPKGDPEGRDPAELVKQLAQRKVDMTIFRVNSSVDLMCAKLKAAHAEGAAAEGGAGQEAANFVLLDVQQQLGQEAALPAVGRVRAARAFHALPPGAALGEACMPVMMPEAPMAGGWAHGPTPHFTAFSAACTASVERCMASAARM